MLDLVISVSTRIKYLTKPAITEKNYGALHLFLFVGLSHDFVSDGIN